MAGPSHIPEGHLPCPNCGHAVLPQAPLCPNCGTTLRGGARAPVRHTGLWILLAGLALTAVAGGVFFFACVNAFQAGGKSTEELWFTGSMIAGGVGMLMIIIGFVMTLVQTLRR